MIDVGGIRGMRRRLVMIGKRRRKRKRKRMRRSTGSAGGRYRSRGQSNFGIF